jgi:hypothetical protein
MFGIRVRGLGFASQDGEEGHREHREGDVAIPAMPRADLVFVQPGLLLGRLEAALDGPSLTGGDGNFTMDFSHYAEVSSDQLETR